MKKAVNKALLIRYALLLFAILPIPFVYNACNGNMRGANGSSNSSASTQCKVRLEKGLVTKLAYDDTLPPAPFASAKVKLRADLDSSTVQAKASDVNLAAGSKLSVVMDNKCLQDNQASLSELPISTYVVAKQELYNGLNRQAYEWVLDRAYTSGEVEAMADREACVIGLSWNKPYQIQSTFSDPNVSSQTYLTSINAFSAYDAVFAATGGLAMTGAAVQIAVIDTGVDYNHPDIRANMWVHSQGVGVDATTLKTSLVDFNPMDISTVGHGTHVSGMIAAVSNNGLGIVGAMPFRAKIMGIKVFKNDGSGGLTTTSAYFYNAMQFAYLNGAQVINLSLGSIMTGAATDSVVEAGISEAIAHGSTVVTVIGNAPSGNGILIDGTNNSSIPGQYAAMNGVIGVGAFDTSSGEKSYFSNYSTTYAEIGAPGEETSSLGLYSTIPTTQGSYGRLQGTSQAAPQVSAAAGLIIGLIKNSYSVAPTPAEVERILLTSAAKSSQLASYFKNGNRLDLARVVAQVNLDYPLTKSSQTINLAAGCAQ